MVFPISLVTLPGFSGYRIGTTNSSTLLSLGSTQLFTTCPSLGSMEESNLSSIHLSVLHALILPSFRKLYTSAQLSAVHFSGWFLTVPSHSLEHGCRNSRTSVSLFIAQGSANKPSHPIFVKLSASCCFSSSRVGTIAGTDLRLTGRISAFTELVPAIANV